MPETPSFRELFLPALDDADRDAIAALPDLEAELDTLLRGAREPLPEVACPVEKFFPFLARRIQIEEPTLAALRAVRAQDLYLLCAYLGGDPGATRHFETHCMSRVEAALARFGMSRDITDEVKQSLRHLVLLDRVNDPTHTHYAGQGSLVSWLCATGVREAWRLRDKQGRDERLDDRDLLDLPAYEDDQELVYLKRLYRHEFKEAFGEALSALESRERNILRYHVLKGLNIERIGAIYGVHRATVARWIAQTRETLLAKTLENLKRRVAINDHEAESILHLIESQLDVSLRRRLEDHTR